MQVLQATEGLVVGEMFRLERRLGTSPNADTWLAHDLRAGDAPCVLKILGGADLSQVDQLHAFEREARVLGGLSHAGIPKVIGAISDPRGAFILAIEYIPGQDLATHLTKGPRLGQDDLVALARDLLGVLDYLHTRSPPVFHRDIKPSNIVRRPDGSAVLVDFGAVCDGWRSDHTVAVGTFGYMAPEQLHGHVTPKSDLYALGATLLHLATGRTPSECMAPQLGALAIPSGIELPPALSAVIRACIAVAPGARPANAKAAMALLDAPLVEASASILRSSSDSDAIPRSRGLVPNAATLPEAPRSPFARETVSHFERYFDAAEPKAGCLLLARFPSGAGAADRVHVRDRDHHLWSGYCRRVAARPRGAGHFDAQGNPGPNSDIGRLADAIACWLNHL